MVYNDTKTAKDRLSKKTKTGGIFAKRGASLGKVLGDKISKTKGDKKEMYQCQSYFDKNNKLKNCSCGKCK